MQRMSTAPTRSCGRNTCAHFPTTRWTIPRFGSTGSRLHRNRAATPKDRDHVSQARESPVTVQALPTRTATARSFHMAFVVAWFFCLLFYFMQYALRSAPGVMHPELTAAFGLSAVGVSSLIGVYYYTYSTFSLIAGAALDRWGAKYTIPLGVTLLAIGSVMFGLGIEWEACCRAPAQPSRLLVRSTLRLMGLHLGISPRLLDSHSVLECSGDRLDSLPLHR